MDTPRGFRLPDGMLPVIQKFVPGQLVLFCVHPNTNRKVVAHFQEAILQAARGLPCVCLFGFPGGSDYGRQDGLDLESEKNLDRQRRGWLVVNEMVGLVWRTLPQRFTANEMEADVSFHLLPAVHDSINIQIGKYRSVVSIPEDALRTLNYRPEWEAPSLSKLAGGEEEPDIVIEVRGKPRTGATLISAMIADMLTKHVDSSQVMAISAEGDLASRYQQVTSGKGEGDYIVKAKRILVHDTATAPLPLTPLRLPPKGKLFCFTRLQDNTLTTEFV